MKADLAKIRDRRQKHGIYTWLKYGKINASVRGFRKLQRYLEGVERDLIGLQGGPERITIAQELLVKSVVESYGVLLLATMYCKREGILRPDRAKEGVIELQPVLGKQFIAYLNAIRQNLQTLGLDRKKADEVLDLGKYLEERAREKERNSRVSTSGRGDQ
jgi:hypothetical protein